MPTLNITLSEDELTRLRKLSERFGVSVEDLARFTLSDLPTLPEETLIKAMEKIVEKKAELYRRLA